MRISDWSSDVCSSDLQREPRRTMGESMARDSERIVPVDRSIYRPRGGLGARRTKRTDDAIHAPPSGLDGEVRKVDHDVPLLGVRCDRAAGQGDHVIDALVDRKSVV